MINSIIYAAYSFVLVIPDPNINLIQKHYSLYYHCYYANCGYITQYIYVQKVMLCFI